MPAQEWCRQESVGVCERAHEWLYVCQVDAVEELCVQRCRKRKIEPQREWGEEKGDTKEKRRDGDRGRKERGWCVFLWGATEGIVFPPRPLPGPSQKPPGVPGFLRKNISAPITPEPSAGLFTLAWPPDSFTDVTYRHTGTLSQRGKGSRSTGGAGGERDGWGMEEWGGWRTSDEERGWRGGGMAQVKLKRREYRGVEREVWGSESVGLLWS